MKKYFFSILMLIVVSAFLFAAEGTNDVQQAFAKAFNANDLEAVMALYAEDAVMFPPDVMEARGAAAIRENFKMLFENFTVKDFKFLDSHHETQGSISTGWGKFSMTMTPKAGGDPIQMTGRYTDVAKKIKGKWLYIADQASVPLPPPPETAPAK